ncbi:hypothetical protein MED217_13014 [Leeuwenhoekiella blandensis MED217]|uniref:Uncharacterized protein n=1 Tax=Leeuwenhoekiella blandensis (strain CECT 7118 / CCUG 51940 / KCTC 22103 / MED217) TaxID=398720 RepID=A3XPU7_LEEBM|nr:hypothetical protein MED217_13014 [Leeuwenhoekiella blandensis MED217]
MDSTNDHDHHKGQQPHNASKQAYDTKYCRVDNEQPKQHLPYVRLGHSIYYLRSCSDLASQN